MFCSSSLGLVNKGRGSVELWCEHLNGLCPALRVITAPLNDLGAAGSSHSSGGSVAEKVKVSHHSTTDEPSHTRDRV